MKVINFSSASDDPAHGMEELCDTINYMLENSSFGTLRTESVICSTLEIRNWLNSPERVAEISSRLSDKTAFLSALNRSVKYNANIPPERKEAHYRDYLNFEAAERIANVPVEIGGKVISPERLNSLKIERAKRRAEQALSKSAKVEAPENPFASRIANMIKQREAMQTEPPKQEVKRPELTRPRL